MRKKTLSIMLACAATMLMATPAFAAGWQKDNVGWWYQNDDGTYPKKEWRWLDGNGDGIAECYYFNPSGYCVMNAMTPDGYSVNVDGAWVVNGVVQTQKSSKKAYSEEELLASITRRSPYIVREKIVADFNNDGKNEIVALMIDTHGEERGCTAYRWYSDGEHVFCFSDCDYWWLKTDEFLLIPTEDGVQLAENILWRQAGDEQEASIYKFSGGKAHLMFHDSGFSLGEASWNGIRFCTAYYEAEWGQLMPGGSGTFAYKNGKWQIGKVDDAGQFGGTSGFYNEE